MTEADILAPLAFVVVSLIAGALLKVILTRVKLPYTVGLFVLGMVVGVVNSQGYLDSLPTVAYSIESACNLDPDLILNLFLPILIFSAAYELDIHIFKRSLTNATLLAVPGLIIAMLLTAAMVMGVTSLAPAYSEWNWTYALMFGALISATDPVAVVALLGELGVSKRFSTLIDGESMLNDGTGIVMFMLVFAPFTSSVDSASSSPIISFLVVVFGGVIIGYLLARMFLYYITLRGVKGDSLLQTSVMILLSYITFILAQDIFKLSGVIALVAFGLVIAYNGASKIDRRTQEFIKEFWALLSYIANTLIFIIIGIIIADKVTFSWRGFFVVVVIYLGINLARVAMLTLLYPILKRSGYGLSLREAVILTWGALRGALGLTLALMVLYTESIPESVRGQILGLTAGIVTLTLVVNATTIKWLLKRLGLLDSTPSKQLLDSEIRAQIRTHSRKYIESLHQDDMMNDVDWQLLNRTLPREVTRPSQMPESDDLVASLRMQLISCERQSIHTLFDGGIISFEAKLVIDNRLNKMVDLDGYEPLNKRLSDLLFETKGEGDLPTKYEVAYGVLLSQRRLLDLISTLDGSYSQQHLATISDEIKEVEVEVENFISTLRSKHPDIYKQAVTLRAQRMVLKHERERIEELLKVGMIDEDVAQTLCEELESRSV